MKLREGIRWHWRWGFLAFEKDGFSSPLLFCQGGLFQKQNIRECYLIIPLTCNVEKKTTTSYKLNHKKSEAWSPCHSACPMYFRPLRGENPLSNAEVAFQKATVPQVALANARWGCCCVFFFGKCKRNISKGGKYISDSCHIFMFCVFFSSWCWGWFGHQN